MRVALEGCMGSGKTTTARLLAERWGWNLLLEETASHPFLADFYRDPRKFALETELCFVLMRYHQGLADVATPLLADFSPVKDLVFGRMNLRSDDLKLFETLYSSLSARIAKPDLVIFLDPPIATLQERIQRRGRPYETDIPASYLRSLRSGYLRHLSLLGSRVQRLHVGAADVPEVVAACVEDRVRAWFDGIPGPSGLAQ